MGVDRRAWVDRLFREHGGSLFAYLRTFRLEEDDLYDLVQSVFIKLMGVPPGSLNKPRAWLFTVGRNMAINDLAQRKKWWSTDDVPETLDPVPDALDTLLRQEENRQLWKLFNGLTNEEQEMFRLHLEHDLSHAEIGRIVGRTTGAVKVALHRARNKLKEKRAVGSG